jgi:hypothetical protein
MGLNRAYDRSFFVIGGSVRTSGGSNQLSNGQLAVVDLFASGDNGAAVLSSFLGIPKDKKRLAIQIGGPAIEPTRSFSDAASSTIPFALSEIKKLRVSAPERTEQVMDELILGYNGFDDATAFSFKKGQSHLNITLELRNGAIQYRGGATERELVHVKVEIPDCDPYNNCEDCDSCANVDCQAVTLEAIERLKNHQISGGLLVSEFVDITPVFGNCDNSATAALIPYVYYTLDVCDTGDAEALALVQAQYDVPVIRINRTGSTSTYQLLLKGSLGAPADYVQSIASIIKGCAECPAGYTVVEGGYLYAITIEDDGTDRSSVISASLASAKLVAGTVQRAQGNNAGVGYYTAVYTSPITSAEIASFVGTSTNSRNTATIDLVGDVHDVCENSSVTEISWVAGDSCNAITETYSIVLPDNECGEDRLAELQGAYSGLTIEIADSLTHQAVDVELSGTSGTATISVNGADYGLTFATSLTNTANAFVSAHGATLQAAGITVTADAGVLTFVGLNAVVGALTIANATGDLDGVVGAPYAVEDRKNCFTRYTTSVISNLVCEACSPVFLDYYRTSAPDSFGTYMWKKDANAGSNPSGNCLCGIKFKGKPFILSGDEALRDIVAFTESGTELQVSGGYADEIREGIGFIPKGTYEVTWVSRYVPRTHLYGNLRELEKEGRAYFRGTAYQQNYLTRLLLNEEAAVQNNVAQAVVYYVEVDHNTHSNGFAGKHESSISYQIFVEYGKHQAVEDLLNALAANAGISGVHA